MYIYSVLTELITVHLKQIWEVYGPSQLKGAVLFSLSPFCPRPISSFSVIHRLLSLAIHKESQELSSFYERAATALQLLLWVLDAAVVLWEAQNLNFLALQRKRSWMFQLMHSHPSRALEQEEDCMVLTWCSSGQRERCRRKGRGHIVVPQPLGRLPLRCLCRSGGGSLLVFFPWKDPVMFNCECACHIDRQFGRVFFPKSFHYCSSTLTGVWSWTYF